ncbi:MAG: flavodoxin domain-containing protein, partial [Candidatus Bathyarchaeia archaeon]
MYRHSELTDMPKIVIVYESMSGNTEKMAKAVAEGASSIKGVDVEIYKVGTRFPVSSLDKADAIIV